jgi:PIF1-like helicase
MTYNHALDAVDRFIKVIIGYLHLYGGITVLLVGDFRKTLAVVRGGSHRESLQASITTSTLW